MRIRTVTDDDNVCQGTLPINPMRFAADVDRERAPAYSGPLKIDPDERLIICPQRPDLGARTIKSMAQRLAIGRGQIVHVLNHGGGLLPRMNLSFAWADNPS